MSSHGPWIHVATCPNCDVQSDVTQGQIDDAPPKEGDVSICFYCAYVSVYTTDGSLRHPTAEESAVLTSNHIVLAAVERVRSLTDPMDLYR